MIDYVIITIRVAVRLMAVDNPERKLKSGDVTYAYSLMILHLS